MTKTIKRSAKAGKKPATPEIAQFVDALQRLARAAQTVNESENEISIIEANRGFQGARHQISSAIESSFGGCPELIDSARREVRLLKTSVSLDRYFDAATAHLSHYMNSHYFPLERIWIDPPDNAPGRAGEINDQSCNLEYESIEWERDEDRMFLEQLNHEHAIKLAKILTEISGADPAVCRDKYFGDPDFLTRNNSSDLNGAYRGVTDPADTLVVARELVLSIAESPDLAIANYRLQRTRQSREQVLVRLEDTEPRWIEEVRAEAGLSWDEATTVFSAVKELGQRVVENLVPIENVPDWGGKWLKKWDKQYELIVKKLKSVCRTIQNKYRRRPVELRGPGQPPRVLGEKVSLLSHSEYKLVKVLV